MAHRAHLGEQAMGSAELAMEGLAVAGCEREPGALLEDRRLEDPGAGFPAKLSA